MPGTSLLVEERAAKLVQGSGEALITFPVIARCVCEVTEHVGLSARVPFFRGVALVPVVAECKLRYVFPVCIRIGNDRASYRRIASVLVDPSTGAGYFNLLKIEVDLISIEVDTRSHR